MGKLDNLFKGLSTAQKLLNSLDQFIDVDRLIAISNAQGPQAKLIRAILEIDPEDVSKSSSAPAAFDKVTSDVDFIKTLPSMQKKRPKTLPKKKT